MNSVVRFLCKPRALAAWALGGSLALASAGAWAADNGSFYLGAGYGATKNHDIGYGDDTDQGWKAFIGAKAQNIIGWEVGYTDLGRFGADIPGKMKVAGWTGDLIVGLPLGDVLRLFARGGAFRSDVTYLGRSDQAWDYDYGAGVDIGIRKGIGLRAEWQRFKISKNDAVLTDTRVDMASASLLMQF